MSVAVSYCLDESLKRQVADAAAREGIPEVTLVSRLLAEGLKTAGHPGVVYRGGPAGRRAGLTGGPDIWEIVIAVRHAPGTGDHRIVEAADQLGLPESQVRLAVAFAAAIPVEIDTRIADNTAAAYQVRESAERYP